MPNQTLFRDKSIPVIVLVGIEFSGLEEGPNEDGQVEALVER